MPFWKKVTARPQEERFILLSDCKVLVESVTTKNTDSVPTWQALETIGKCIIAYTIKELRSTLRYARREFLTLPHHWANVSRRSGRSYSGRPPEDINITGGLG